MSEIFKTEVVEIGADTPEFKEIAMAILFGNQAPDALRSSCFIINIEPVSAEIKKGMKVHFDDKEYTITAVGGEVQTNLTNLGHIAVSFTGLTEPELPGTLYVSEGDYPEFKVGTTISITD